MNDDIEIRYNGGAELTIVCGEKSFARLRDVIIAEAGLVDAPLVPGDLRSIGLWTEDAAKPSPLMDRIALIGCAFLAAIVLTLLVIGAETIFDWIFHAPVVPRRAP